MKAVKTEKKIILFAVLDWGLGHATRSMPIINLLISRKIDVVLGACGPSLELLKKSFPQLDYVTLPSWTFAYPRQARRMPLNILLRIPAFWKARRKEQQILHSLISRKKIDGVISDNRYGLFSSEIPCRIICHQTNIIVPKSIRFASSLLNRFHHYLLNQFEEVWIPDTEESIFAGNLSQAHPRLKKIRYIGGLTRFDASTHSQEGKARQYAVGFILSGPEPQRSILEDIILEQCREIEIPILLVRGLPGEIAKLNAPQWIESHNHLDRAVLQQKIQACQTIVSRSGYSTIMDLSVFSTPRVFIPTPGQSEQEYLADYWALRQGCSRMSQESFSLSEILQISSPSKTTPLDFDSSALTTGLDDFISAIRKNAHFCGHAKH